MKKFIFGLAIIVILVVIVVFKANVGFTETSGKVVDSSGEPIGNAQIIYNYRCVSGENLRWQTNNVTLSTDSSGRFDIPSYKSFKLSNIGAECSKQLIAFKDNYSHYKNTCQQAINRIGINEINNLDIGSACADKAYVNPSSDTVSMRLDLIDNAPNYDPLKPNMPEADGSLHY